MKPHKIVFVDQTLEDSYINLSDKDPIKKGITKAIRSIKENIHCGRSVKKKLIPKDLLQKYNLNNLWIYNLPSSWRLLYSITPSNDIKIIAALLDWTNHKDYERLFNF